MRILLLLFYLVQCQFGNREGEESAVRDDALASPSDSSATCSDVRCLSDLRAFIATSAGRSFAALLEPLLMRALQQRNGRCEISPVLDERWRVQLEEAKRFRSMKECRHAPSPANQGKRQWRLRKAWSCGLVSGQEMYRQWNRTATLPSLQLQKKLTPLARLQVRNFVQGTGLIANVHITHVAGTTLCGIARVSGACCNCSGCGEHTEFGHLDMFARAWMIYCGDTTQVDGGGGSKNSTCVANGRGIMERLLIAQAQTLSVNNRFWSTEFMPTGGSPSVDFWALVTYLVTRRETFEWTV